MRPASGSSSRPARIAVTCAGACACPITTSPLANASSTAANRKRRITSSYFGATPTTPMLAIGSPLLIVGTARTYSSTPDSFARGSNSSLPT